MDRGGEWRGAEVADVEGDVESVGGGDVVLVDFEKSWSNNGDGGRRGIARFWSKKLQCTDLMLCQSARSNSHLDSLSFSLSP